MTSADAVIDDAAKLRKSREKALRVVRRCRDLAKIHISLSVNTDGAERLGLGYA